MTNFKNLLYILVAIISANITYGSDLPNNNNNNNKRSLENLDEDTNPENNGNSNTKKLKTEEDSKTKEERTQIFFKILDDIISNNKILTYNDTLRLFDLIKLGIDVNNDGWDNKYNNGIIFQAITKNRIDIVMLLLQQPNLNLSRTYPKTHPVYYFRAPIILFTLNPNFMTMTKLLLEHHALHSSMNNDHLLETLYTFLSEGNPDLLKKCDFLLSKYSRFNINSKFSKDFYYTENDNPTFPGKTILTIITIIIDMLSNRQAKEINTKNIFSKKHNFSFLLEAIQWLILNGADIYSIADKTHNNSTHIGYKPSDNPIIQTMYSKYQEHLNNIKTLLSGILPKELISIIIGYDIPEKSLYNYQSQPNTHDEIDDQFLNYSSFYNI